MSRLRHALVGAALQALLWLLMAGTWLDQKLRGDVGFPRDPAALEAQPEWLVAQLVAAGLLPEGATPRSLEVVPFKQNEAFRSQVARVRLCWRAPDDAVSDEGSDEGSVAPRVHTLVAKFAPQVTSLRDHAVYLLQDNCGKEVAAYRAMGDVPEVGTPNVIAIHVHPLTGNLCLLLEDLTGCTEHTERDGCPPEACAATMDAMAALHAWGWERPERAPDIAGVPDLVIDWLAGTFTGPDAPVLSAMTRAVWRHDNTGPQTVLHGDARVGNQLFGPDERFAFIDWQAARRGRGVFDVAYFMTLSVDAGVRREHEQALLDRYHAGLLAGGVRGYDREALWRDYRLAQALTLCFVTLPFLSAESSGTDDNQGGLQDLGDVWTWRMIHVVDDLDIPWLAEQCGVDAEALAAALARTNREARADLEARGVVL